LVRDIMLFGINIGEVGTTVQLDFRPNLLGAWETLFTALIMEFDPPGGKASIVALSCDFDTVCVPALFHTRSLRSTTASRLRWAT
jgi:hypothetical protein